MNLCSRCGWACERVRSDYGEDLLVQLDLRDAIESVRMWLQVKGTTRIERFARKRGGYSLPISFAHALKWVRSSELVVVVLWDVEENRGFWSLPLSAIDDWDWYLLDRTKTTLWFAESSEVTAVSLQYLAWMARMLHFTSLLNDALMCDADHHMMPNDDLNYRSRTPLIAYEFLTDFGILTADGISPDVVRGYRNGVRNIRALRPGPGHSVENMAAMLAMMVKVESVTGGLGVTSTIMNVCGHLLRRLIEGAG